MYIELKRKAIEDYKANISVKDIIKKYGIPRSTIYFWLKNEKIIQNSSTIKYQDFYDLQHKYEKLKLEFEIYEKLHCFKDSTNIEKEVAISKFIGKYPIKAMCRVLNIPTGTLYNYHFRRKIVTNNQLRDEQLKEEIYKVFKESGERFGAKKIWIKLGVDGIHTSLNKVQKLMKLLNIHSIQSLKRKSIKNDNSQYYINKLKRLFNQTEPNKYWVSDVTEIKVGRNKFYLCVILDLFSRKVIAYRLSSQNNTALTINTFKDAYENRDRPTNLSFHSDQGSNYTAFEFKDLLRILKVDQSFSKAGNPYDNACMESFFSSFKREEYNSKEYEYFDDLKNSVDEYMKYYNEYRPHQSLKNKTPNIVEDEYYSQIDNKKITIIS